MKKEILFKLAIIFLIIGLFTVGIGVGKIFERPCIGGIIGLGLGFIFTSIIFLRTVRRLGAYEKK